MLRFIVSAFIATLALFATFFVLSKAVGPGTPADAVIVGQLELFIDRLAFPSEQAKRVSRPPPRPEIERPSE